MSKLRKSASFRSRIPISQNRLRRRPVYCCNNELECERPIFGLKANRSFDFDSNKLKKSRSGIQHSSTHHSSSNRRLKHKYLPQYYLPSSDSSSDESYESEVPFQVFNNFYKNTNNQIKQIKTYHLIFSNLK